jgi:hypothetical protein
MRHLHIVHTHFTLAPSSSYPAQTWAPAAALTAPGLSEPATAYAPSSSKPAVAHAPGSKPATAYAPSSSKPATADAPTRYAAEHRRTRRAAALSYTYRLWQMILKHLTHFGPGSRCLQVSASPDKRGSCRARMQWSAQPTLTCRRTSMASKSGKRNARADATISATMCLLSTSAAC